MPERRTNYVARVLAVLALAAALVLVAVTITTSGGDSDDGDDSETTAEQSGTTKKGQRALDKGVWIVREGDTLVSISAETGIELDELVELNPDIDPQVLATGQRVSLRRGDGGADSSTATDESSGDPADEFGDGSVDDENSGSSDGI
jgi:hypothetical protein